MASATSKKRKVAKQRRPQTRSSDQINAIHNQALMNSARDAKIAEAIKQRMKATSGETFSAHQLADLEKRRIELLKWFIICLF